MAVVKANAYGHGLAGVVREIAGELEMFGVANLIEAGAPGDRHPNWITVTWPPEATEILDWQWREVLIPYWRGLVAFAEGKGGVGPSIDPRPR